MGLHSSFLRLQNLQLQVFKGLQPEKYPYSWSSAFAITFASWVQPLTCRNSTNML